MSDALHPNASHSLLVAQPTRLKPFVVGSIIGHVGLFIAGAIFSASWGEARIDLNQKPINATLVRLGKPRDEKLLPRKEELPPPPQEVKGAEEAPPKPDPAPAPQQVAVPIPGLQPEKKQQKQAGETSGERRNKLFSAFSKTGKATKVDELAGREDGDPMGDSAVAEGEQYFGLIRAVVTRYYDVSNTIPEAERIRLKAAVTIRVGRAGEIIDVRLAESSRNDVFDSAVMAAVKRAGSLAPPPEHLRDKLRRDGVTLVFRP